MITIRTSTPADGERVVDIWRRSVDATHDFLTPEDRQAIEAEVAGFLSAATLDLALVEDALRRHPDLTTDVNEQNAQAVGFYERMGFARTGRSGRDGQGRAYPLPHLRHRAAPPA